MSGESAQLEVIDRKERGTSACRRMRKAGKTPLNLYGLGREPRAMYADSERLGLILEKGHHILELKQQDKNQVVLIKDIQYDAIGSTVVHADLMRIDSEKTVHVFVPVRFIGNAAEVSGSSVDRLLEDIQVECLPLEIPEEFVVSITGLALDETITVKDIEMPKGCTPFGHDPDDPVVIHHIKKQKMEEEAEDEEGEESVEPEVIGKKPDEDGEES